MHDPPKQVPEDDSSPQLTIDEKLEQHCGSKSLDSAIGEIRIDTRVAKILFGRLMALRLFLALLLSTNIFLALTIYEHMVRNGARRTRVVNLLSVCDSAVTAASVVIWICSSLVRTQLGLEQRDYNFNPTRSKRMEYAKLAVTAFLISLHPFAPLIELPVFWEESYWERDFTFHNFRRSAAEYLIFCQFVVNFTLIAKILIQCNGYANNRAYRISTFFGITNDFTYTLRAVMKSRPILVVLLLQVLGILFFGVLIRIAETGFIQHLSRDVGAAQYIIDFDYRATFLLYSNTFWYIIGSMATVGFGELNVCSTFGRFVLMVAGLYGVLVTTLMVLGFSNLFEMQKDEQTAYSLIKMIESGRARNEAALTLTSNILLAGTAYLRGDMKLKMMYKSMFKPDFRRFCEAYNDYRLITAEKTLYIDIKANKITENLKSWNIEEITASLLNSKLFQSNKVAGE